LITDSGVAKAIEAQNNEGFKIYPQSFGVSRDIGTFSTTRTGANAGMWYQAPLSAYEVIDQNTIKIICTIPQNASPNNENIREIYIFAKDINNVDYMFALGQPTEVIRYDYEGTTSLELQISLVNIDLTANIVFNNTMAVELHEHEIDANAHPEIAKAMAKHGIFIPTGAWPFNRRGQSVEFPVQFEGTKAGFTHGGVQFTATYNGTELNGSSIVFDGIKTVDQIRASFNALNYPNTIEHNGAGTEVLAASTKNIGGGTYIVADKDFVYKDVDGIFKRALADGSNKSRVAGIALRETKTLVTGGLVDLNTGYPINTSIYLSGTNPGKFTDFNTNVNVGLCLGDHIQFTGFNGDISTSVSQEFDAVVSDAAGAGLYSTTQLAINAIPNNGRILMAKLDLVKALIDTTTKNFTIVCNNPSTGWKRFLGQTTQFQLSFSQVPTNGTFRFEWSNQESNDIPWNATAIDIQVEFNLLSGHNGVQVTGDFLNGFIIEFLDNQEYTLPTFIYAGRNEIQHFSFSQVPDNGTLRFKFKGEETVNYAFNDNLSQLQQIFDDLAVTNAVSVSGDYSSGFTIEFIDGYLQDGNQEQPLIQAVTNFLYKTGNQVEINGQIAAPIDAIRTQVGKKPASNLYVGTDLQTITATYLQLGEPTGPDRLMNVNNDMLLIHGNGVVEDFTEGFALSTANSKIQFQGVFNGVSKPVMALDNLPGVNLDIDAFGFAKDVNAQLRLTEHATNKKKMIVSGVDFTLPTGITLTKELNSFKMLFTGAIIDFSTGIITAADGVTALGVNFTPPTITPTMWKWASINIQFNGLDSITQQAKVNLSVSFSSGEGATKDLAPRPTFGDNPIGLVALRGALGDKEKTVITTVKDQATHRLAGTTLILYHPLESVAFYVDDGSGIPLLAQSATRAIPVIIPLDTFQAQVASIFDAAINADARFVSTVVGNKITVENSDLGAVADANMGDTGFFYEILVQGTDTDVTGIDDIVNENILQLSLGSGSGSGEGSGGDLGAELADLSYSAEFLDTFYKIPDGLTSVDIAVDKTDPALYDVSNKLFKLKFDGTRSVSGVGINMTLSGTPSYTIRVGDVLIVGTEVKVIDTVISQTQFEVDSVFTSDPTSESCIVSQCVHTYDINKFDQGGTKSSIFQQMGGSISELMIGYDSALDTSPNPMIPDYNAIPTVGYIASTDGVAWSEKATKAGGFVGGATEQWLTLPTIGDSLYLKFFSNKLGLSGYFNFFGYKAFFHRRLPTEVANTYMSAYANFADDIFQSCTHTVVGGKSRLIFNFAYSIGVNPGQVSGSILEVALNGINIPRYNGSFVTSGQYFKEITDTVIELDQDYTGSNMDLQARVKYFVVDVSTTNTARIAALENPIPEVAIPALAIDWSLGNVYTKSISANSTFSFINELSAKTIIVRLVNTTAGSLTVAWPVSVVGSDLTTVGANKAKIFTFIKIGTTVYASAVEF